jgi:hypothetical protein
MVTLMKTLRWTVAIIVGVLAAFFGMALFISAFSGAALQPVINAGLVGLAMFSPVILVGVGVTVLVVHFVKQSNKAAAARRAWTPPPGAWQDPSGQWHNPIYPPHN